MSPQAHRHGTAVQKSLLQWSEKATAVPTGWVTRPAPGHHGVRQLHPSRWESPGPAEAKLALPGSLVVDAEGMEDVQEGCDEGEELHERKKGKSWGQLGESNPISSQCSWPRKTSQPRALSSLKEKAKPPTFPRRLSHKAIHELLDPEKPTLAARCKRWGGEALTSMTLLGLGWLCCGFNICSYISPRGTAGASACLGFSGLTHRCGAVELVVKWRVGAKLGADGCIGLQDSSAHVQNGCGTVVQTVLQCKGAARIKACPGLSFSDSPWGWGPSCARASAQTADTPRQGLEPNPCTMPNPSLCPHSTCSVAQLPSAFPIKEKGKKSGWLQKGRQLAS